MNNGIPFGPNPNMMNYYNPFGEMPNQNMFNNMPNQNLGTLEQKINELQSRVERLEKKLNINNDSPYQSSIHML